MFICLALKLIFVKKNWLQDKRTPEMYIVEFVELKYVTVAQSFFFVGQCY